MNFYDKICIFFSEPRKVLTLTFCAATILAIISITCSGFIYGDAVLYTTMAHYFALGEYTRGFQNYMSPLFPVMGGLLCKLGIPAQYSTHIVSCTFCVLTIFPLYYLLCFFMEKKYAAWGCMFYIFAPKILRFGMASQMEGTRFFFLILPIYLIFSFAKNKKISTLIWLGMSLALYALVRGEGIIFAPMILFALMLLLVKNNKYNFNLSFLMKTSGYCLLSIIIMFLVISPRLYQIYLETGYPALDTREAIIIKNYYQKITALSHQKETPKITTTNTTLLTDQMDGRGTLVSFKRILNFLDRFSVGTFELYEILFFLGVILLLRKKEWTLEHNIMLMFVIWNALIFYFITLTYRYFIVNVFLLMPFIITGYRFILDIVEKHKTIKILFPMVVFFVAIGQIQNGMADSIEFRKKEPRYFGTWIKEHKDSLINSKNNFHILLIGYPDFCLFTRGDFTFYNNKQIISSITSTNTYSTKSYETDLQTIIKKGFPAQYSYYTRKVPLSNTRIIPDLIVISPPKDYPEEVKLLKSLPNLQEVKTPYKDYLLFKNLN